MIDRPLLPIVAASGDNEYSASRLALIKTKSLFCRAYSIIGMTTDRARDASMASCKRQRLDGTALRMSEAHTEPYFDEVSA